MNKPNGQTFLKQDRGAVMQFIDKLGTRKIPSIGGMLETTLSAMGIEKVKQLRERAGDLIICFKESTYGFLI